MYGALNSKQLCRKSASLRTRAIPTGSAPARPHHHAVHVHGPTTAHNLKQMMPCCQAFAARGLQGASPPKWGVREPEPSPPCPPCSTARCPPALQGQPDTLLPPPPRCHVAAAHRPFPFQQLQSSADAPAADAALSRAAAAPHSAFLTILATGPASLTLLNSPT